MKKFLLFLLLFITSLPAFTQLDVLHYIPPLYGRTNVQNHYMILSTPNAGPVTVNVMNGQGTLIYTTVITDVTPNVQLLGTGYAAPGIINTAELNTVNPTDGFIVQASAPIYVNIRHVQNAQGLSLNSKGASTALGTRFRSGHIFQNTQLPHVKTNEISVMASENNTTVTFTDIKPGVIFRNTPVTGNTSNDITVVLNAGESYTIAAWLDEPLATNNANGVNGTLITSDKPIACNTGSWLGGAHTTVRDIGVDQIVPVTSIGQEYIFVEGDGNANTERPLVVAEYDNTQIFVNGNAVPTATINAGEYIYLPQTAYSANDNIYIVTSQPAYMYQSLSGSDPAATGLNFIPPLRCNGFKKVVIPSVNLVGVPTVSITARANADVFVNGSTTPLTGGLTVPGNACWLTYKIPGGTGDFTVESDSIINVALLTLQGVRGSAGYFTGFTQFTQIDQGDTSSFVVCSDSASSYVTYSIGGPYIDVTANFYNPALNGQLIVEGFNDDTLFFTYVGDPNTTGPDTLELTACKLLECCGAIPDTVCEVSTLVFTNVADINTGLGDSIVACADTADIVLEDLLLGPYDASGYWVDTDNTGALFGNSFNVAAVGPGIYHFTYYVDGGSLCYDSTVVEVEVLAMSTSTCCSIAPNYVLTDPTCNGLTNGSILITDNWATMFSIDSGTTLQGTGNFSNIGSNTYDVHLTFGPDCIFDTTITLNEPAILDATFNTDSVSCNGLCDGELVVNANGGTVPYQYSLGGAPAQGTNTFTGLCAGPATITLTDSNNCQAVFPENIFEPAVLVLTETAHTDETCTLGNGGTTVTPAGGTGPYTYTLDAGASQSSASFSGLSAGTYTIEVTDANGCTDYLNITIVDNPSPVPFVDVLNNVTCAGALNGSVTIGVTGGDAPFQYSLDAAPNQASNTFPTVGAGNHTVVVTDANGCTGNVNFNITQPSVLQYSTTVTDVSCFGYCDGWIAISASGANAPYMYSDDNGLTFQVLDTLKNLCPGPVNVVVQDANGCLANSLEIIGEPTQVTSIQGTVDPICHGTPGGEISFAPAGGTPGYQYSVDNGNTFSGSSPVTGLYAGTYDIIVEDVNGCQFADQVVINEPPPFTFNFIANNPSNCGANDGSFEIVAAGGSAPYFYSIDGGTTVQVNNGFFGNLFSGLYNLVVTDADGCADSTFSPLSDNVMVTQTDVTVDVTCYNDSDGLGIVSQQFGAAPYTYTLNTTGISQPTGVFPGLSAGVYFVTIQDGGLCIGIEQFEIFQPDSITFTNSTIDITCPNGADGEIDFTNVVGGDGGPYTYSIDGGTTYQVSSLFTGLSAGNYTVFAQDGNGCLGSATVVLDEPNPWNVVVNATNLVCNNDNTGFIQIVGDGATGPYGYTITGIGTNGTGIFAGLAANNYNITVTDALGCTLDTVQTLVEPLPLGMVNDHTDPLCFGSTDGSIEVTASGGTVPYLYSSDNGVTLQSSNILNGLSDGCYDVYLLDDNGCSLVINECVNQPDLLTMSFVSNNATCGLDNADLSITAGGGTPGYTYSNNGGSSFQLGNIFDNLAPTSVDIVLQDANGCTIDSTITLLADPEPVIDNVSFIDPLCFGSLDGSLTISSQSGVGLHEYSITSAAGPYQGSNNFGGLGDGNYTVYVRDDNGCVDSSQITVTQPADIVINTIVTNLTCFQNNTGQLNVSSSGGTVPYQYSLDNGITFQGAGLFSGLAEGNYTILVEDVNGCQQISDTIITEPDEIIIDPLTITAASCYGLCDGTIVATVTGGTAAIDYSYTWSGGITSTTNTATNVCQGTYSVIIQDDNGCIVDSLNFLMDEPALATIDSVITTPVSCWGDADGSIEIYSANAGFYSIGLGFTASNQFNGLSSGIYMAYVQDSTGCPGDSTPVFVSTPQELIGYVTPDEYICFGDTIYFSVVATGGTQPYDFNVNGTPGSPELIIEPIFADTIYTVLITDVNGCDYQTDTMNIFVAPPPILTTANDTVVCYGDSLALFSEAADLTETYNYLWNTGDTIPFIYPTVYGDTTFHVSVTDECGLTTDDSITVTLFPDPIVTLTPDTTGGCAPFQINYTVGVNLAEISSDLFWNTTLGTIDSANFTNLYITYTTSGTGDIDLTFTSSNGCPVDTTFINPVDVYSDPVSLFEMIPNPPTIFDIEVDLINISTDNDFNYWFFLGDSSTSEHTSIPVDALPADSSITVCLVVENAYGCLDTSCQALQINNEMFMYVPNAIFLDGHSTNSIFLPVTNYFHPDYYHLYIFNRWGELLFETEDLNQGWDGSYNGVIVPDGVYVWKIVGAPVSNEADLKEFYGHVTVLK